MQRQTILLVCGATAVAVAVLLRVNARAPQRARELPPDGHDVDVTDARLQAGGKRILPFVADRRTDTPAAARQAVDDVEEATPVAVARVGTGARLPDPQSRRGADGAAMPVSAELGATGNSSVDAARTGAGVQTTSRLDTARIARTGLRRVAVGTTGTAREVRPDQVASQADAAATKVGAASESAGPFAPGSRTAPASVIGNLAILGTPMPLDQETHASTVDAAVAGDSAVPESAPQEVVVEPLHVRCSAKSDSDGTASIVLNVAVDAAASYTPNGVVIAQTIPAGWEVVRSEPAVQSFDSGTRVAKWLFTGRAVAHAQVVLSLKGADAARLADVNAARAWYSYRQQNGKIMKRDVVLKSSADTPDA